MGTESTLVVAVTHDVLRVVSAEIPADVFPLLTSGQNAGVGLTPRLCCFTVVRTLNTRSTLLAHVWVYNVVLITTGTVLYTESLELTHLV